MLRAILGILVAVNLISLKEAKIVEKEIGDKEVPETLEEVVKEVSKAFEKAGKGNK
jgi:hypothetical protein